MHLLRLVLLVAVAPICFLQGCDSGSNESLPNSGLTLCLTQYELCVEPILHTTNASGASCSQGGCHNLPSGVPSGGFGLTPNTAASPATPAQVLVNFTSVEARTLNNDLLLNKAALLNGTSHGGGLRLRQGDVCYNTIAEWRGVSAPTDGTPCTPAGSAGSPFNLCVNEALAATCGQP